jgi:hypothetical protein
MAENQTEVNYLFGSFQLSEYRLVITLPVPVAMPAWEFGHAMQILNPSFL